jgi:hypothetical protein
MEDIVVGKYYYKDAPIHNVNEVIFVSPSGIAYTVIYSLNHNFSDILVVQGLRCNIIQQWFDKGLYEKA